MHTQLQFLGVWVVGGISPKRSRRRVNTTKSQDNGGSLMELVAAKPEDEEGIGLNGVIKPTAPKVPAIDDVLYLPA